jgi:hypothetical protein
MTNWRAVGVGFIIELSLGVVGLLVPGVGQLVAGLVGGFVAGYIGSMMIRSGLWHGLLAGSLGGFLLAIPVGLLVAVASIGIDLTNQFGGLIAGVGTAVVVVLVATILGANSAIGGAIGGFVKGKYASHQTAQPETAGLRESNHPPTGESGTDRAVSTANREESSASPKLTDVIQNQH